MLQAGDTYVCANCGGRFKTDWSDADAGAEYAEVFPQHRDEPIAVVCDDCYLKLTGKDVNP